MSTGTHSGPTPLQCQHFFKMGFIFTPLFIFQQLFNGPVYSLLLSATVTKPALQLSRHEIDFETVVCGQCRIATVRISNPFHVRYIFHHKVSSLIESPITHTAVVGLQLQTSHQKRCNMNYFTVHIMTHSCLCC